MERLCVLKATSSAGGTTNALITEITRTALEHEGRVLVGSDARISPDHLRQCGRFAMVTRTGGAVVGDIAGVGQSYSPDIWPARDPYQRIEARRSTRARLWVKLDNLTTYSRFPSWEWIADDGRTPLDEVLSGRGQFSVVYARERR